MGEPLSFINEDGWAYPDDDEVEEPVEPIDPTSEADDDLVALHALTRDDVIDLTQGERAAIAGRFGFDGHAPRTLAQLHDHLRKQMGLSHRECDLCLAEGLEKLRGRLST
jgi:DNA-directed RNA polymerase sigma subunit (sigma70/sigma32)